VLWTFARNLKPFVSDDFDAEAGQSPKMMSRGCEMADRCDAQIPKDLRAYSDFAPLLVAVGLDRS
jgi:hypothetical protein